MQPVSDFYNVNNVSLHVLQGGNKASPAILFLHGFPSFWYSWQKQIDFFVSQNFYVIVPDQRGYNKSSKPQQVSDYRLSVLIDDIVQLLSLLQITKTYIVAHDWGGIVAWALLKKHPQLFYKAVIINAPYLPSYAKFSFQQLLKSWYVYFFQLPFLPEWIASRNDYSLLTKTLLNTSLTGTFSHQDIELYKESWRHNGSLKAMINWYRALAKYREDVKIIFSERKKIEVPVLLLWGMKDKFLNIETGVCSPKHCENFSVKKYDDATHWLPLEKCEEVNEDILQFFNQ